MKFFITLILVTLSFCGESFSREKLFYECDISNLDNNRNITTEEDIILFKKFRYIYFHTDLVTDGKLSNGHLSSFWADWYPEGNMWDNRHIIATLTENLIIVEKNNRNAFDYKTQIAKREKEGNYSHVEDQILILRKDNAIFIAYNFIQKQSSNYLEDLSKDEYLFLKCLKINKEDLPKNIE